MGTENEPSLLLKLAVPMMLSMMVQALYNVVDSIYVARVSEDCLTALSLSFPAQNIMIGIGTGTGVGLSALVSRALGAGNDKMARRVSGNGILLSAFSWLLMVLFGVFAAGAFVDAQTKDPVIRDYTMRYLRIVTICSLPLYLEICVERLLQSTGQTRLSMWTQMAGAVTNILLDPLFIFGFGPIPAMDTAGAAVATVLGQVLGAALGFVFHLRYNREITFKPKHLIPEPSYIREIYRIGFPSILMTGIMSLTNYLMNLILIGFTSTAVAVYGAYFKLQSFFFMPVFGLNNALVPIIGYNFGAGKKERIYRTYRFAVLYAAVIMITGFLVFELLPEKLLGFFSASEQMLRIGVPALRRIALHFPFAAYCIMSGSTCQALGKGMYSFINSVMRSVVVLIPAAYLLSLTGDVNKVWYCFIIAEGMSLTVTTILLKRTFRDMEKTLAMRAGGVS